ncbi:helix-turn-helix domain-containing protein [Crossiella cryophila]|uniref:PucR family transcriptional regulator n=1 Tax=Crossiella cryophila TaxID=43355 RepID=A0A7W7CC17_9PSEU|nr:helix-turn-helix domain-containing protein [Crossiella cryophila]MBB4678386.1 hypothetical protein [Crossiella cryophila]
MVVDPAGDAVAGLGLVLLARAPELAEELTRRIRAALPVYRTGQVVTAKEVRATCLNHIRAIYGAVGRRVDVGTRESFENGRVRARAGMPLATVMEAYRVSARFLWEQLTEAALAANASGAVLMRAATDMWQVHDVFTQAMADGYREELTERLVGQEQRRSAVVQALLEGGLAEGGDLWVAADVLRLPPSGPYVVLAANVREIGESGLPQVESRLRAVDIPSVWRLQHDEQLGVAALTRPAEQVPKLLDLLRTAVGVGVSPAYHDLTETPQALTLARIALSASTPDEPVVLFDRAPLAVAAVSAPEVMRRVARGALAGLDELPERERLLLLDTFAVWLDSGSARTAAATLHVHANTVRHRLRRLEERTGRSLSVPRQLTELGLAAEIDRRLGR